MARCPRLRCTQKNLILAVNTLPIAKPTETLSEAIQELRKTYPRSHEPWSEKEILFFNTAVKHTNDVDFLSHAFQRSPNSMKGAYEQMLKKQEVELVK